MAAIIHRMGHAWHFPMEFREEHVRGFASHPECPTCGGEPPFELLAELGAEHWGQRVRLVQCTDCQTIFYENPPDGAFIRNYYEKTWNTRSGERENSSIQLRHRVRRRIANLIADIGYTDMSAKILDIGCGLGDLMAGLAEAGFTEIWGTEISRYRVRVCERRFPGRIFVGFENVPDDMRFDIIYANHVLEHLVSPAAAFAWMKAHLRPNGIIILSVPNSWFEPVVNQVLFLPHLHSFCTRSFWRLGERNGMTAHFWTQDRFWDLTAAFVGPGAAIHPAAGRFATEPGYRARPDGCQRSRIAQPWLGDPLEARHLAMWATFKFRDPQERDRGYRVLSRREVLLARSRLTLARACGALGWQGFAKKVATTASFVCIAPQSERGQPPVVCGTDGIGLFDTK